ncbi:MAG: carbamate kinase [Candidatus Izemoplasmatales bacterium]|jgi:carbamate kinase|nr:carbamate kinase [Candidatus Izemoplasmatales bacterium]MDD3865160.1 carbamate kinase [Candidatus Izemoplasmatales bacterium]
MSKIVIALGGNALGNQPSEQIRLVGETVKPIVELIKQGHQVIISHGNGPQVGMINNAFEAARKSGVLQHGMPFPECGAMSQGYIGYHLQNALAKELVNQNLCQKCVTIISQVEVDPNDIAFQTPTKPIGPFYTQSEAEAIAQATGYIMKDDSNRGFRRVIASPKPIDVIEIDTIKCLVENNVIVITVGGGGIPVVKDGNGYIGVPAVIDKDFASQKLADLLDADYLFILTAVECVSLNFGKPNQVDLRELTVDDAKTYIRDGHFAKGSMLPKVEAAMNFASGKLGRVALIGALEKATLALEGKSGTRVIL